MTGFRRLALRHPLAAACLLAAALLMKALVPGGYMISASGGRLAIELCSGSQPRVPLAAPAMTMGMAHDVEAPAMRHHPAPDHKSGHEKPEMPCAFAGLSLTALAAADPVILAIALLFVMMVALRPTMPRARPRPPFLRPPLRGPPAVPMTA